MPGPGFTQLFGGNTIYPAQPTFLSLNPLTASVVLQWPFEQQSTTPTVAEIVEVNATAPGLTIQLSDARQIGTGYCALFNNIGANTFTVLDANGGVLAAIASGTVWELYLADNSTLAGTWRIFQFGAGVSAANAAALAGAGLVAITTTLNQNYVTSAKNANYVTVVGDRAKVVEWTGGTGTFTLDTTSLPAGWFVALKNSGSGIVTVSPSAGTIDSVGSIILHPLDSTFVIFDGANFYTLGFGQTENSIFDFLQIPIGGASGTVALSGAQLNRVSYKFTGALAGNVVIQVPSTIQQYWVDNSTTGAFTLTVATSAGGGAITTAVNQGSRNILYSDGTNVVPAVTFGSTGFTDGTAASPSIFFTSSPHTGLYKPGGDQIAISTASTQRVLVDATGHLFIQVADDASAPALTVNNPNPSAAQPTVLITGFLGFTTTSPGLQIKSTAVGAGFALMSLTASGATLGSSDVAIAQSGINLDCLITNKSTGGFMRLGTKALDRLIIDNTGQVSISAPDLASASAALQVNAKAGGFCLLLHGQGSPLGIGAPAFNFTSLNTTGAATPTLTANKPGANAGVIAWVPAQSDGVSGWMPIFGN